MRGKLSWFATSVLLFACNDDEGKGPRTDMLGDASMSMDCEVPTEPEALLAYLKSGAYKTFPRESARHPSAGPHGGEVLTYLNPELADSLEAGNEEHPICAASIKELFRGNDEVSGWAVMVKNYDQSREGQGYYWYEILGTEGAPDYAGQGLGLCVDCHASGSDYVRTRFPLE
jgi:hypothetical protein